MSGDPANSPELATGPVTAGAPPAPAGTPPIPASRWYPDLGDFSFPTVFIRLHDDEIAALVAGSRQGAPVEAVVQRLNRVIKSLPGAAFIYADCCAPTDSAVFTRNQGALRAGRKAWEMLTESAKVRQAFAAGHSQRLALHSYRRMDPIREFRMFVRDRELRAMSQMCLRRHFGRLERRGSMIWRKGKALTKQIGPFLPCPDVVVDVYLTSQEELMLIDLNPWGPPTDPLLLRDWEQDWSQELGLRLLPPPVELGGDVSVSF